VNFGFGACACGATGTGAGGTYCCVSARCLATCTRCSASFVEASRCERNLSASLSDGIGAGSIAFGFARDTGGATRGAIGAGFTAGAAARGAGLAAVATGRADAGGGSLRKSSEIFGKSLLP
jgi:hypothetical protein